MRTISTKRIKAVVCSPPLIPPLAYFPYRIHLGDCADSLTANYSYTKPEYPSQYPTGDGGGSSKKTNKKDSRKKSKKGKEKVDYDEEDEEQQDDDAPYTHDLDDGDPRLPQGMTCFGPFFY